ncbi:MAG: rhomboid family intramembrane serine protease [Planctomycetaceae bacterium]
MNNELQNQRNDEPRLAVGSIPPSVIVTRAIVIANVAVYCVMVARGVSFLNPDGQTLLNWGANFGPVTMNGQWWRLVTCMFLHFGIVHLGMNMWVLWGLAPLVERFVGKAGFAIAYMVSGIAGSLASLAWHPTGISAGASGAVFGTAGALLGFVVLRQDSIPDDARNRMLKSMATFLILNTVIGMSVSRIDMAAHIGGFIGGVVCGLILSQPLTSGMFARRKFRNLMAIMGAAILLPIGVIALPEALPDIGAELQRLEQVESQIYDNYNVILDLSEKDDMDDSEFAEQIEQKVLPPWIRYRADFEGLLKLEYVNKDYLEKRIRYIQCREESWRQLAQGLKEQDDAKLQRARELAEEGQEMLRDGV